MNTATSTAYSYKVVRQFAIMTVVWGIVGMGLGVFIAAQLAWPFLNFDLPWTSFGRLRPLHTNAVIFAFGGCALFATSYYSVQRTCQTTLFAPKLAAFTFWGWQLVIVLALTIGLLTPPVGLVLYVLAAVSGVRFDRCVRATAPFLIPLVAVLLLVAFVPQLSLALPMAVGK